MVSALVQAIVARCVKSKTWRSECQKEVRQSLPRGESLKEAVLYVDREYERNGAGFSGRWQTPTSQGGEA